MKIKLAIHCPLETTDVRKVQGRTPKAARLRFSILEPARERAQTNPENACGTYKV
jgi:hypothetical protein